MEKETQGSKIVLAFFEMYKKNPKVYTAKEVYEEIEKQLGFRKTAIVSSELSKFKKAGYLQGGHAEFELTQKGKDCNMNSELARKVIYEYNESDKASKAIISFEFNTQGKHTPSNSNKYIKLLQTNKNIVLTGAPGTGKSYLAKQIAEQITGTKYEDDNNTQIAFVQFHPSYDYTDFVEGLRAEKTSNGVTFTLKDGIFKEFCKRALYSCNQINCCDDDNSIDDAINIFKKDMSNKTIRSIRSDSLFKILIQDDSIFVIPAKYKDSECEQEKRHTVSITKINKYIKTKEYLKKNDSYEPAIGEYILENYLSSTHTTKDNMLQNKYVFIIDEINRGEIAKIFGELFFSIDPGYRGLAGKVKTQYANLHSSETDTIFDPELGEGWFYVPENVYIIGTMNDIDRSVECMDFAMRRRFTWIEVDAESRMDMLDDFDWAAEAKARMKAINKEIEETPELGKAYHIGPAYFLKLDNYVTDGEPDWKSLWSYHLEPLLKEYLRGMPQASEYLGKIEKSYFSKGADNGAVQD